MSESTDQKNEMTLTAGDAAAFLRRLADQLEAGGLEVGEVRVETDGEVKIKQSVKTKEDKVAFKLKLKYETPLNPEVSEAMAQDAEKPGENKPSYKSLKKRMAKSLGKLKKLLGQGVAPEAAEIEAFAADCELLTTFPDKGEEHYPDFMHHVEDLKKAMTAEDSSGMQRALAELAAMRKACHEQYK